MLPRSAARPCWNRRRQRATGNRWVSAPVSGHVDREEPTPLSFTAGHLGRIADAEAGLARPVEVVSDSFFSVGSVLSKGMYFSVSSAASVSDDGKSVRKSLKAFNLRPWTNARVPSRTGEWRLRRGSSPIALRQAWRRVPNPFTVHADKVHVIHVRHGARRFLE